MWKLKIYSESGLNVIRIPDNRFMIQFTMWVFALKINVSVNFTDKITIFKEIINVRCNLSCLVIQNKRTSKYSRILFVIFVGSMEDWLTDWLRVYFQPFLKYRYYMYSINIFVEKGNGDHDSGH